MLFKSSYLMSHTNRFHHEEWRKATKGNTACEEVPVAICATIQSLSLSLSNGIPLVEMKCLLFVRCLPLERVGIKRCSSSSGGHVQAKGGRHVCVE